MNISVQVFAWIIEIIEKLQIKYMRTHIMVSAPGPCPRAPKTFVIS